MFSRKMTTKTFNWYKTFFLAIGGSIHQHNFDREQILSTIHLSTRSKDMDSQLKLAHRMGAEVDCPNRLISLTLTLLGYNADRPQSFYARVRSFRSEKVEKQTGWIYFLLVVMTSLYKRVIVNQSTCNVLQKLFATNQFWSFFFLFQSEWVGKLKIRNFFQT